ncbi:chorismate mutase [Streptomyces sp. NPDC006540]|uniref:chorismate mutase n=1 Tax=Streptomyces sp. NPDC006540 TaxID=3155353 RepID=UPI0033B1230D
MSRDMDALAEDGHRTVAELDESIIDLVRRRTALCRELTALRRAAGAPAIELSRENAVLRRYREALGREGTSLAMLLIELERRPRSVQVPTARPAPLGERLVPAERH